MKDFDAIVVGGGIVGLATAYQLTQRFPDLSLLILEKESTLAAHQTGHNSGVLHSGIYYRPGSLKAVNCRAGKQAMQQFCDEHGIPYDICGKVIVAVTPDEVPQMEKILERGKANGITCERIGAERLRQLEPQAAGVAAIHVPEAGIVDYRRVCEVMAQQLRASGAEIRTRACVTRIASESNGVVLDSTAGAFRGKHLVNCAGLQSDRVTRLGGQDPQARIIPFRGEYFKLREEAKGLCRNLIYPVPDPSFPFLGVHFTRMINGDVECGPNAVLAFAREGYRKTDLNLADLLDSLTYAGFLKLAFKYWRTGAGEMWRSVSKAAFVRALQRLLPAIRSEHLESAPAGVRAQAVSPGGAMVDDFLIHKSPRITNVCNAPSPAATSSLNIGQLIVDHVAERLKQDS